MKAKDKQMISYVRQYLESHSLKPSEVEARELEQGDPSKALELFADKIAQKERAKFEKQTSQVIVDLILKEMESHIYALKEDDNQILQQPDLFQKINLMQRVFRKEIDFWKALLDFFPTPAFIIDSTRKIKYFNKNFIDMAGWSPEEIYRAKGAFDIFWPQDPQNCPVCAIVGKYSFQLKQSGIEETKMRSKDGKVIPAFLYVIPVFDDNGEHSHTFGIVQSRYEEFQRRSEYLASEIEPIIAILNKIAERNISERIEIGSDSELKNLESPINQIIENLRQIIGDIMQSSDAALMATETVDASLENLFNWYNDTYKLVQSSLYEISAKMESSTSRIEKIINLIQDIADQTNLLSLNASIVANKAGEHGRGFAVVASEVRQLAQKSYEATEDVSHIIHEINHNTQDMAQKIQATEAENATLEKYLNSIQNNFDQIQNVLNKLNENVQAFSL